MSLLFQEEIESEMKVVAKVFKKYLKVGARRFYKDLEYNDDDKWKNELISALLGYINYGIPEFVDRDHIIRLLDKNNEID